MDATTNLNENRACALCMHWYTDAPFAVAISGKCRRNPPTALNEYQTVFPQTRAESFCGEFTRDAVRVLAVREAGEQQAATVARIEEARKVAEESTRAAAEQQTVNVLQEQSVKLDQPSAHMAKPPVLTIDQAKKYAARRAPVS